MPYRLLGNSGLRVSEAALGTMTFGDDWCWGAAKDEARKVYDAFREAGGNFIDTANVYTNGTSESFLGEFMQGHRQSLVLATKYTNAAPGTDPNAAGKHRKSMMQAEGLRKPSKNRYFSRMNLWCSIPPDTLVGLMKANRRATLGRFGCSLHNDLEATPWVVQ